MRTIICDRCGEEIEREPVPVILLVGDHRNGITQYSQNAKTENLDLCPACAKDFDTFMRMDVLNLAFTEMK